MINGIETTEMEYKYFTRERIKEFVRPYYITQMEILEVWKCERC